MKNFLSQTLLNTVTFLKGFHLERFLGVFLAGVLFLTTNVNPDQHNRALGKAVRDRVHQLESDSNPARPKTTGESNAEVYQDIPATERAKNITRDSVDSLKGLGSEYSNRAKEGAGAVRNGAAKTVNSLD